MTKVVVVDLNKRRNTKASGSLRKERLRSANGKTVRVLSLDANSKTFNDDLALLFKRNVAKARRDNNRLLGSPSGVPARK